MRSIFDGQYHQALVSLALIPQAASRPETGSLTGPISSLKLTPFPDRYLSSPVCPSPLGIATRPGLIPSKRWTFTLALPLGVVKIAYFPSARRFSLAVTGLISTKTSLRFSTVSATVFMTKGGSPIAPLASRMES